MPNSLRGWIGGSAILASMCCLPSVIWVLFAGSSAIIAADQLSNNLYYSWVRWALYGASAAMLTWGLILFFRSKGICTFDDVTRERRRVINTTLATFTITILFYLAWNYVVLEIVGIAVGLPWEDSAFWN
ncbi:MAG: hypothetical protein EB162_01420 [Euryarchaeota archaeon]|nr:hypothetical protein [Euryarchaeota archaeon]